MINLENREGKGETKKTSINLFCEQHLELPYLSGIMTFFKYWIPLEAVTRQKTPTPLTL